MYINETLNFCFIHVPKTAGSSIRTALSGLANIPLRDAIIAKGVTKHPALTPTHIESHTPYWAGHEFYRDRGRQGQWDKLMKFAVVRNPFSHAYSLYKYEKTHEPHPAHAITKDQTFAEWINRRWNSFEGEKADEQLDGKRKFFPSFHQHRMISRNPTEPAGFFTDVQIIPYERIGWHWPAIVHKIYNIRRMVQEAGVAVPNIDIPTVLPSVNVSSDADEYLLAYENTPGLAFKVRQMYDEDFTALKFTVPDGIDAETEG